MIEVKVCTKCNHESDDSANFCSGCGSKLVPNNPDAFCGYCGNKIENNDRYCPYCGKQKYKDKIDATAQCDSSAANMPPDASNETSKAACSGKNGINVKTVDDYNLNFISFNGRIGRKDYIARWLPMMLFVLIVYVFKNDITNPLIKWGWYFMFMLAFIFAFSILSLNSRRLRDIGLSNWKIAVLIILLQAPVLNILIMGYMIFAKGKNEVRL